jgi:hypothetical protein
VPGQTYWIGVALMSSGSSTASLSNMQVSAFFAARSDRRHKITFHKLSLPNPALIPIGPRAVINDDIAFARST